MKSIVMVPAQFITALCTKQIYLAPGCRSFCSYKIKFHAFVYNAAWKSCLKPGVLHLLYYLFHNPHKQFVFHLLVNSALPETYLLLSSYPPALLHSYGDAEFQGHLWGKQQFHPAVLPSKRVCIIQLGHSRPFSHSAFFIWQFKNHEDAN